AMGFFLEHAGDEPDILKGVMPTANPFLVNEVQDFVRTQFHHELDLYDFFMAHLAMGQFYWGAFGLAEGVGTLFYFEDVQRGLIRVGPQDSTQGEVYHLITR